MQIPLYCSVFALALSALPSSAHPVHPFSPRSPQSLARAQAPADANVGRTGKPVRGVNLGGWLILENWENPSMFLTQQLAQQDVPDEWTWMSAVGNDITAKAKLKKHWDEWISKCRLRSLPHEHLLTTLSLPLYPSFLACVSHPQLKRTSSKSSLTDSIPFACRCHTGPSTPQMPNLTKASLNGRTSVLR